MLNAARKGFFGYAALVLLGSTVGRAQTQPAELPDGPITISITAVTGKVQARADASQPWTAVEIGQEYVEGVELRTALRSVVKFRIPPDSEVTVDRLGVVKVLKASIADGTIKTDVGMKYGRTRYDIESAGRVHDAQIRSTSSVLAIRGTDVILDDTPGFAPRAVSFTGRAKFTNDRGQSAGLGQTNNRGAPAQIEAGVASPAETARIQTLPSNNSVLDASRTPQETQLVTVIPQRSQSTTPGLAVQDINAGGGTSPIDIVPPPPPPANFPSSPGRLEFVLNWVGDADLQIGVISPLGEPITTNPSTVTSLPSNAVGPAATSSASGAVTTPDNTGGLATGGSEAVIWPNGFPTGKYDFGVKYTAGTSTAQYKIDVIVNGVTLDPSTTGNLSGPTSGEFSGSTVEIDTVPTPSAAPAASGTPGAKKKRKK